MRVAKAKNRWQTPLSESATSQCPREADRLYTVVKFAQQQCPDQADAACERPASPQPPTMQLSKTLQTPMSPSVYSRNTDGVSILLNDSVTSFTSPHEHERAHQGGSAVILTSQSVRSYVIGTPSPTVPSSSRSSRDWKAWLSHEVSGIETTSQEDITIHEQYAMPSRRYKRGLAQSIRTSQTESTDTTVILRESPETPTSRVHPEKLNVFNSEQQTDRSIVPKNHLTRTTTAPKDAQVRLANSRDPSSGQTHVLNKLESEQQLSVPNASTPHVRRDFSTSTPSSSSSATQPPLGTPDSARMNDRFPFLDTGRHSNSDNASQSRRCKSPTSSVGSLSKSPKATPGPKIIYSDVSAPAVSSTTADVPNTASRRAEISQNSKENITPPPMDGHKRPNIPPLRLASRPKSLQSLQPRSSADLNKNVTNMGDCTTNVTGMSRSKRASCPAGTVIARPSLRITVRPLSPEKLSRRPRSAFDLRNTPSPRPASEFRRPVLQPKASSRLLAYNHDPSSGEEASIYATHGPNRRDGSVTPGQRMAECFLKERKSATVLERGVRKSTGKFVREDTPAFL